MNNKLLWLDILSILLLIFTSKINIIGGEDGITNIYVTLNILSFVFIFIIFSIHIFYSLKLNYINA